MRILREWGPGAGAALMVLAFVLTTVVPERRPLALSIGGLGAVLLIGGLVLDRERVVRFLKGRRGRAAGASAGYILTVVAVVGLVNFVAGRHHARYDATESKVFSLSEQTIRVLESLPREVRATAFYREEEPGRGRLEDLVDEYRYHSGRLSWRFVDPDKNPGEVRRYEIRDYGTIVFESGDRESRITSADEESLTNALIKVTRDAEPVAYVTGGHGESNPEDGDRRGLSLLKEALTKQHYRVAPVSLTAGVPEDASLLIVPGPDKAFLTEEVATLRSYLDAGGRALILLDPGTDAGLSDLLRAFGLAVRRDVIIDKVTQIFGGDARVPMVQTGGYDLYHPITKSFEYQTFYPMASSIEIAATLPEGVIASRLASTSEVSWGESTQTEVESGRITFDGGVDTKGPVIVGAAIRRAIRDRADAPAGGNGPSGEDDPAEDAPDGEGDAAGDPETRLVLFGDSDFLTNAYFNASGNGDLGLSAIAWLAEREELVSIRPKTSEPHLVILSTAQIFYYFWTIVALMPISIATAGVAIWIRRRRL